MAQRGKKINQQKNPQAHDAFVKQQRVGRPKQHYVVIDGKGRWEKINGR